MRPPAGRGGPPTLWARLLTLHVRVAMATAGLQQPQLNEGLITPHLGPSQTPIPRDRNEGSRGIGAAHPALRAASGLTRAARGGRAARREGGWKERSPGRPTRLCLLCSQRWQRRGGRGGQRAQFSAPRSPGNSCGSARPTSGGREGRRAQIPSEPGAARVRLAARIPQAGRAVSCGAWAGKAGPGRKPHAPRCNDPRPRSRWARAARMEWWAARELGPHSCARRQTLAAPPVTRLGDRGGGAAPPRPLLAAATAAVGTGRPLPRPPRATGGVFVPWHGGGRRAEDEPKRASGGFPRG